MPEGNTIHRLARQHTRDLAGRVVRVRSPQGRFAVEARRLDRRRFLRAEAHGKHLFHRWEGGLVVHIHLGMAGEFYRFRGPAPAPRPSVRMRLSADTVTIDLIGPPTCELITEAERLAVLDRLGPDPLRDDADPARVWQELRRRSRPIGDALLDQRVISGVGNIFRNEALFLAGIHPLRRSNRLTREQWGALWETTSRLMRKGLKEGRISTVDPAERPHECAARPVRDAFYVYQREYAVAAAALFGSSRFPAGACGPAGRASPGEEGLARVSQLVRNAMREVAIQPTLEAWRRAARRLIEEGVPPGEVSWREAEERAPVARGLFDPPESPPPPMEPESTLELRVPRAFLALSQAVVPSRDPDRWRLLYSVLWRIAAGDRGLILRRDDADLRRLRDLADAAPVGSAGGAQPFVPPTSDLKALAVAAASCQGCDLYRHATQTVFGRGPASAKAVLVGEAPGDQEDLHGAPFVGPAGEVLDRALAAAALPRDEIYVTNAVKHFKFERTPKRRIHQTPGSVEIEACRPWLAAELASLSPKVLVCLGATASKALLGSGFRLMKQRGQFLDSTLAPKVLATYHPSAVLRAEDEAGRSRLYETLVADLALAAGVL